MLVNYCALLFSQQISYSRAFPGNRKNAPLSILNNHSHFFYLLRYNKEVHDLTLERRSKPAAEILNFTPLKLDSVNASWFDYDRLDYLFFETNDQVCFFFEKVLNTKRSLYLKIIDSTGRTSGFIDLGSIEKNKSVVDIGYEYKLTPSNEILIISSQVYLNGQTRKTVRLYNAHKRQFIWTKKLPIESVETGYSQAFECNARGDLFYALVKTSFISYKRKYLNHNQVLVPKFQYESVKIVDILGAGDNIHSRVLPLTDLSGLQSLVLVSTANDLLVNMHYSSTDTTGNNRVYFLTTKLSDNLQTTVFAEVTALDPTIESQLKYFDGTDSDSPSEKEFFLYDQIAHDSLICFFSGRSDLHFYKEIFTWRTDLRTGEVSRQHIIPRKIFYFPQRSKFKNIHRVSHLLHEGNVYSFVLENFQNQLQTPLEYNFRKFSRQSDLSGGALVVYYFEKDQLRKKMIFKNAEYDFVPVDYQSNQSEFLFYLNRGKIERFAILPLNQL